MTDPAPANTRRAYGQVLRRLAVEFGAETALGDISAERFAAWFGFQWADRSPSTWNVALDAVRSAVGYWQRQGWIAADPSRMLARRKPRPDRARALSRAEVEQLLTHDDVSLRERTFWRMLYETAARSAEVLALNVEDLDLPNRCAGVRRKGGAIDVIIRQTGTALAAALAQGPRGGPGVRDRAQSPGTAPRGRPGTSKATPGSATSRPPRCSPRPPAV